MTSRAGQPNPAERIEVLGRMAPWITGEHPRARSPIWPPFVSADDLVSMIQLDLITREQAENVADGDRRKGEFYRLISKTAEGEKLV